MGMKMPKRQKFTKIQVLADKSFSGVEGVDMNFQADFPLFLIQQAWDKGLDLEDLADGFGAGLGTHGDWSAIRDSSAEAINRMLERSLNFLFA